MARFLLLSNHHHMLPLAHRLRIEGNEIEVVVWRGGPSHQYERAWEGSLPKFLQRSDPAFGRKVRGLKELGNEAQVVVVSDSFNATKEFKESIHLYGAVPTDRTPKSRLRLGGWFDGTQWQARHLLIVDAGLWPGGLGPARPGAMTLVRVDNGIAVELYDKVVKELTGMIAGFRGLVQVGLDLNTASGEPEIAGLSLGWPFLHTHAFLSEVSGIGQVLSHHAVPTLERKYVTVFPVSVPPWPAQGPKPDVVDIEGLTPKQMGRVFWHDVAFDGERQVLKTAGLDGLVCVVRGAADTADLARAQALELAQRLDLPEKQYRYDAAEGVNGALAGLEAAVGITV